MSRKVDESKLQRIRLLSSELDIETTKTEERTKSVGTKAAFLVVTAGVLSSKTYPNLASEHHWVAALLPVALCLLAALAAIVALFPWRSKEVKPAAIVAYWIDKTATPLQMEDYMLEVKSTWITFQNQRNNRRSRWLQAGFVLLVLSVGAVIRASVLEGL